METKLISIFFKNSGGISSKRVLSVLGFVTCVVLLICSFITGKEVPDFAETVLICCVSLYGVEIGQNWFTKTINKS